MNKNNNNQCQKLNWGNCCCECKYHYAVYSHPCVDGKPMSNLYGYVCIPPLHLTVKENYLTNMVFAKCLKRRKNERCLFETD